MAFTDTIKNNRYVRLSFVLLTLILVLIEIIVIGLAIIHSKTKNYHDNSFNNILNNIALFSIPLLIFCVVLNGIYFEEKSKLEKLVNMIGLGVILSFIIGISIFVIVAISNI